MNFNRWQRFIRIQRMRCAHKLALLGDKPEMSIQERQRIADKTRTTIQSI